jgi:hypothetical protein
MISELRIVDLFMETPGMRSFLLSEVPPPKPPERRRAQRIVDGLKIGFED